MWINCKRKGQQYFETGAHRMV